MDERELDGRRGAGASADSWWLHGMVEQLLWVKLLRLPALALRPQRVVLAVFLVVLVGLIGRLEMPWRDAETPPFLDAMLGAKLEALAQLWRGVIGLHGGAIGSGFAALLIDVPAMALTRYPVETVLLGVPIALVWAVLGGAVCRSVACEVSLEMTLPWTKQLGFAVKSWRTFLGVAVLPGALIGVIALVLAMGGVVLFNGVPGLELLGGLFYGLGLLLALAAAGLVVAMVLGWSLLLPSAACEGTDAIDSFGRVLAYVVARPVRLLMYVLIGGLVSVLAGGVAFGLAEGAIGFAQATAGAWVPAESLVELTGAYPLEAQLNEAGELREVGGVAAASSWMVGFWGSCLRLVATGYALSCVLTAGTLVYLFMRQVCDGQHYAELWSDQTEPTSRA
ncbi:MAG: hypothetical protein HND58_07020 [Planctomycetota bacterium]|nr:MAG: hypothetical protein HND58_07020 [Planctomycetota bacterium]